MLTFLPCGVQFFAVYISYSNSMKEFYIKYKKVTIQCNWQNPLSGNITSSKQYSPFLKFCPRITLLWPWSWLTGNGYIGCTRRWRIAWTITSLCRTWRSERNENTWSTGWSSAWCRASLPSRWVVRFLERSGIWHAAAAAGVLWWRRAAAKTTETRVTLAWVFWWGWPTRCSTAAVLTLSFPQSLITKKIIVVSFGYCWPNFYINEV